MLLPKKEQYPLPFTKRVLDEVAGHESLLIFGWIFWLPPNYDHLRR
jgi:hypothetical protein